MILNPQCMLAQRRCSCPENLGFAAGPYEWGLMNSHAVMITSGLGAAQLLTSGELRGLRHCISVQHMLQWE